ncbi:SH2 domain-containing adapter protein F isoform X3 [Esox lucius]|uniref:SH2 domain-containing adapter protein F isoform X3 n=1 Tax=Esox lucius TaxID=8010 RepID=UPI001476A7A4|nr:SH2 domain-containing adapter protein F isoform X3 [Esox lucius]
MSWQPLSLDFNKCRAETYLCYFALLLITMVPRIRRAAKPRPEASNNPYNLRSKLSVKVPNITLQEECKVSKVAMAIKPCYLEGRDVSSSIRSALVDRLVQIQMLFRLHQETLYMTVSIIDRFHQIRSMERTILKALNYEMGRPPPVHFPRRAAKIALLDPFGHGLAMYLQELTLLDYDSVHYPPSLTAAAAVSLSWRILHDHSAHCEWTPALQHSTGYMELCLLPAMQCIAKMLECLSDDRMGHMLIILDDYADPFDAEADGGNQPSTEKVAQASTENDGYMEPYEAQKMMAEIRGGRGPKEGSQRSLPLYDTPYEPEENGTESESERPQCPRESRLPQDDERPPEEYDQPWEWKKERISKAFAGTRAPLLCYACISYEGSVNGSGSEPEKRKDNTSKSHTVEIKVIKDLPWPPPVGQLNHGSPLALLDEVESPSSPPLQPAQQSPGPTAGCDQHHPVQFDGVEKSRMSPTKDGKGGRPPRVHSSGCLVNTKMSSLDYCSAALGERVDPCVPLESQFWYHGAISRTDAECLLRLCKEASYLVRNSETSKNDFSLSLKSNQGFMHMKLSRTKENKYILGQNGCPFDSVPEIIHFYSSRKLPIKGAEHMSLLYPVAIRTL